MGIHSSSTPHRGWGLGNGLGQGGRRYTPLQKILRFLLLKWSFGCLWMALLTICNSSQCICIPWFQSAINRRFLQHSNAFQHFLPAPAFGHPWPRQEVDVSGKRWTAHVSFLQHFLSNANLIYFFHTLLSSACTSSLVRKHIQGGPKNVNPKCSTHNFVKYWPILKILSPLQSPENLQYSSH